MKRLPLNKHAAIYNIAKSTCYGLHWIADMEFDREDDKLIVLETIAHIAACRLAQEVIKDSVPTNDIVEMIFDNPELTLLEQRFVDYYNKT